MEGCRDVKGIGLVRMGVVDWLPEVPIGIEMVGCEADDDEDEEEVPPETFPSTE